MIKPKLLGLVNQIQNADSAEVIALLRCWLKFTHLTHGSKLYKQKGIFGHFCC